jgi:hypothetical protein
MIQKINRFWVPIVSILLLVTAGSAASADSHEPGGDDTKQGVAREKARFDAKHNHEKNVDRDANEKADRKAEKEKAGPTGRARNEVTCGLACSSDGCRLGPRAIASHAP